MTQFHLTMQLLQSNNASVVLEVTLLPMIKSAQLVTEMMFKQTSVSNWENLYSFSLNLWPISFVIFIAETEQEQCAHATKLWEVTFSIDLLTSHSRKILQQHRHQLGRAPHSSWDSTCHFSIAAQKRQLTLIQGLSSPLYHLISKQQVRKSGHPETSHQVHVFAP